MATQVQIEAVTDAVVTAFSGDAAAFQSFLTRAALETELATLESENRQILAARDVDNASYQTELLANAEARAAKEAEIDAL